PDIDLFVVTAAGRAYLTYTLLFLVTKFTGTRHVICPNYLIDENELVIRYHRDLFTAHQLVSARPLSGRSTYLHFCRANESWVRLHSPAFSRSEGGAAGRGLLQRLAELVFSPAAPILEPLLRAAWRTRLRRRAAAHPACDVALDDGILKLHLSDYRQR